MEYQLRDIYTQYVYAYLYFTSVPLLIPLLCCVIIYISQTFRLVVVKTELSQISNR